MVTFTLTGLKKNLDSFSPASLHPNVDLSGLEEGTHHLTVNLGEIKGLILSKPAEIDVTLYSPEANTESTTEEVSTDEEVTSEEEETTTSEG